MNDTKLEKLALLGLSAACIISLTIIALVAMHQAKIGSDVATLIGVIATGLIAWGKDIVAAIRSYAMSAQLGKVTDQLAASGPAVDTVATGKADDPINITPAPEVEEAK